MHVVVGRDLAVGPERAWAVLVDLDAWPRWGPSVRSATLDDGGRRLVADASGRVVTALGVGLPFEVSAFEEGRRWSWRVAGVPATTHTVVPIGPGRCRVELGVPLLASPYVPVCRVALPRIARAAGEAPAGG